MPASRRALMPLSALILIVTSIVWLGIEREDPIAAKYQKVAHLISRAAFDSMRPIHQDMLVHQANQKGTPSVCCWYTPPGSQEVIDAFNAAISGSESDFQLGSRWSATATTSTGLNQGTPTVLTYSFVPDGTSIPSGVGEPVANSTMFATFNAAFGSTAAWQNQFAAAFQRWSDLTGTSYVLEPNDDGSPMLGAGGQLGVRGDIRIGSKVIDGFSGTLAYNFFPNNGDMVLDSGDITLFDNPNNTFRFLRNVVMHEHGHGIGLQHVCPDIGTKLMEPFINTNFDGPQHDDLQGGQRHYGDNSEPNDTSGTATSLGLLGNGTTIRTNVSTDDNSDIDFYSFTVSQFHQLTVTVTPVGSTYGAGPQITNCGSQTATYDSLNVSNLGVDVRDANGTTILATSNVNGVGANEVISNLLLPNATGPYFVRVFPDTTNSIQLYTLNVTLAAAPNTPFTASFQSTPPQTVLEGLAANVNISVVNIQSSVNVAQSALMLSTNGGPFLPLPLTQISSTLYQVQLPAGSCLDFYRWYVSLVPNSGGTPVILPASAPTIPQLTDVNGFSLQVIANDNFETDNGWQVTNSVGFLDGQWTRGTPVGGGDRGDPGTDGDGSGQCWLTDNVDGDSDVDGGSTTLTSPPFNLTGFTEARVGFLFWYDNAFGNNPLQDTFLIQVSNDNVNWITMETYNAEANTWLARRFRVSQFVALNSTVRFRFIAQDTGAASVVEAGVDGFKLDTCPPPPVALDASCGAGNVGVGAGGPFDVLSINGSTGGAQRRVNIGLSAPITLTVTPPPTLPAAQFALYGYIGFPTLGESTIIPFVGVMCFTPCPLEPTQSFTVTNNFFTDACPALVGSTPAPWTFTYPQGLPFPFILTFQGVIADTGGLRVTNGVIMNVQ